MLSVTSRRQEMLSLPKRCELRLWQTYHREPTTAPRSLLRMVYRGDAAHCYPSESLTKTHGKMGTVVRHSQRQMVWQTEHQMGFPHKRTPTAPPFCISQTPAGAPFLSQGMVGSSKWLAKGRSIKEHSINKLLWDSLSKKSIWTTICVFRQSHWKWWGQPVAINSGRAESTTNCVNYTHSELTLSQAGWGEIFPILSFLSPVQQHIFKPPF